MEIQHRLRTALAKRLGEQRYNLWFGPKTRLVLNDNTLSVFAADRFACDWLRKHFGADLDATCIEVVGHSCTIEFKVDSSLRSSAEPDRAQTATATNKAVREANHRRSIETRNGANLFGQRRFASLGSFVAGDCNRMALTAVRTLLREPGSVSPLVIYGPTGVGKTHLLEGMWSQLRQHRDTRRVVYLTAEQFTSYFLEALQGGGLPRFRHKYRDTQILLLDDIQFFANKKATVMELQHTIDAMLREGRQIVLAADRRPSEIPGLGKELTARLEGGLLCEMHSADGPTRLEVARRLAGQRNIAVPNDVLELIARRISGDARRISGALNRLQAASAAYQQPITVRLAQQCLADLWGETPNSIELETIEQIVSEHCGVSADSLRSSRRARPIAQSRMLAMWLARKFTRTAYKDIGSYFGGRSHSTVISAQRKVNDWIENGLQLELGHGTYDARDIVDRLEAKLRVG